MLGVERLALLRARFFSMDSVYRSLGPLSMRWGVLGTFLVTSIGSTVDAL